ncbi:MAG TPA: 2-oxoglutarate dehydrogenase E1 component [Candidatus Angelobacter sp.]|jgi:2-oxoglutarate dehydrogenase E1 component|nr:2-oxoglutarate dehydrogenase E1 component [Candidatus Angelobacter sp.]
MTTTSAELQATELQLLERERVFDAFRHWGYLEANLHPFGGPIGEGQPELHSKGEAAEQARRVYCGSVGYEFMHLPSRERREWLQEKIENPAPFPVDRRWLAERLLQADLFEQILQTRYLGTKRYSGEGNTSQVPLLDMVLETAADLGANTCVIGGTHRGRLTLMTLTVGIPAEDILAGFEDVDPRSVLGGGDVKYHKGATGQFRTRNGKTIRMHLVSNPSHLEAVDPVALGRTRAKQTHAGENGEREILPVVMHGDAAFAGQGILAEALNYAGLKGFSVGGCIHVIVNNLIGFTTTSRELHTSRFSADLAKRQPVPIFHVNTEDPEAVLRIGRLAAEYRFRFGSDVVIDLIGYRRHGHSEVDDPTITQPLLYKKINAHPPLFANYAKKHNIDTADIEARFRARIDEAYDKAAKMEKTPSLRKLPAYWDKYVGGRYNPAYEVPTAVRDETLNQLTARLTAYPAGFAIHPKIKRLLEQRQKMGTGKMPIDYGMAEALAFASLLTQGIPVRLSGQDSRRGTFNHRHSVLIDTENEQEYVPLSNLSLDQAWFAAYNSILSEAAVLGFEYGFSRDYPDGLVLWEAQFGDFANGAQIIIDQFIVSGEDKWGLLSGLVMLLPHGYEGQGPEHSSARMERYLQLAAKDNIQVCQPSTAGQYFHMLRRQALRSWRKPLIVFTPKGMLRHPDAASSVHDLAEGKFQTIIQDNEITNGQRVILCTGKIGHELRRERKRRNDTSTAIIFVEQLFPLPEPELEAAFAQHTNARDVLWVQEEPANMGALSYISPHLERLARGNRVRSVKRSPSSTPATGSHTAHEMEQKTLMELAFAAL